MIDVQHLTKSYGGHTAVSDVSFRCQPGTVTGFLGPNGAGKSTTMRMMCGLTPPTSGTSTIGGKTYTELTEPPRTVGVLLDASAQHAGRTGQEVLTLAALTMGLPTSRAKEALRTVGLQDSAAKKRVKQYSLGMRQRLGIAQALMGDPEVLILDEPANGLDPEGIRWMRSLLRGFADRGGTVLLSSHLLTEVQAVADQLVFIRNGSIVAGGNKADMLAGQGTLVRAADATALEEAVSVAGLAATRAADGALRVDGTPEAVGRAAAASGVALVELRAAGADLEDMFLELTTSNGAAASDATVTTEGTPA